MEKQPDPEVFTMDTIGGNGTPFRFMYWPREEQFGELGTVRYYDRRYPVQKGQPGYGINHATEDGQCAGGALYPSSFHPDAQFGIRGWHDVDAWDVDMMTARLVGRWIEAIQAGKSWA